MTSYVAMIHKDPVSDFHAVFPDFPGCVATGATLDAVRRAASEALSRHLEGLRRRGETLPEPAPLEVVMGEPAHREAVAFLVPASAAASGVVQVAVTLPEGALARIDAFARRTNTNRSTFLTRAALHAMRECGGASGRP